MSSHIHITTSGHLPNLQPLPTDFATFFRVFSPLSSQPIRIVLEVGGHRGSEYHRIQIAPQVRRSQFLLFQLVGSD